MRTKIVGGILAASILAIPTAEAHPLAVGRPHYKNPGCHSRTCDNRVGRKWWKKHHPKPKIRAVESGYAGGIAACIRKYESGNNYRAINPTGKYRGAYQFDYATFAAAGGHGDPAAASPAEQDAAFARWWPGHHGAWPLTSRKCGVYS